MNARPRDGSSPVTIDDLDEALELHSLRERDELSGMIDTKIADVRAQLLYAFPDGVEGHRKAHQALIDAAKAEQEFWSELRRDVAKKSIWGILHILTVLALGTLAVKLGIGSVFGLGK
jgi:hypothetical protein